MQWQALLKTKAMFTQVGIVKDFSRNPLQNSEAESLISAADMPVDLHADEPNSLDLVHAITMWNPE